MTVILDLGTFRQVVTLSAPGAPVPDGDGGYTQTYAPLDPETWRCKIESSGSAVAVRHFAATVIAQAQWLFSGRFHPGISAKTPTRVVWTDRAGVVHTGTVLGDDDVEGAGVQTLALVTEIQP
jgi:hypothetical protein